MKKTLIVGNWKMNLSVHESSTLLHRLSEVMRQHRDVEVIICPSMLALQPLSLQIDKRKFKLGAQNAFYIDNGPYTGEVSFNMLRGLIDYAVVGHSDRRYKFGESLAMVRDKTTAAVRNGIVPIICVGETKQERLDGETMQVIQDQVTSAVSNLTSAEIDNIVIAYEPVWALSNGRDYAHHEIPTPEVIARSIKAIRFNIQQLYGPKVAEDIRVLYGGSSNASTAPGLLAAPGVDGLFVGGASLNYQEFNGIIEAAYRQNHKAD